MQSADAVTPYGSINTEDEVRALSKGVSESVPEICAVSAPAALVLNQEKQEKDPIIPKKIAKKK